MRQQRWFPIAALATGLFAINVVARLIVRFGFDGDETVQSRVTLAMFGVIGVTLAIWTFVSCQRRPPSAWLLPDLVFGAVGGMLLTVLVGPFVSGSQPFANDFAHRLVSPRLETVLGRDHRSRSLAALTVARGAKPRRTVRR